jgi:hypothetical protein
VIEPLNPLEKLASAMIGVWMAVLFLRHVYLPLIRRADRFIERLFR